jgi:hypothetical protein
VSEKKETRDDRFVWKPDEVTIVKKENAPPPPADYADAWANVPPPGSKPK